MAINPDSKGYKALIKNGYTDEQITQMQNQVLEGQSAKDVVANTPAANPSQRKPKNTSNLVDPIAYRPEYNTGQYDKYIEWWDPTKLNNADINLSQYWDDSSSKNYNNSALWWWENSKYTWENTLGSQIAYNPNATLAWLDPNYLYWQAAQMQNSQDANYIARRNDEIASALYNEWLTSIWDVAEFLSKQNQRDYSNENERQNTIMSVWKRIWQIAEQNKNNEPAEEKQEPDMSTIEEALTLDSAWKIYGKVATDEGWSTTGIDTLADPNSIFARMNQWRINNVKALLDMSAVDVATSMYYWTTPYWEQAMRDLNQYYPDRYKEIQQELKKMYAQDKVNNISNSSWEAQTTTSSTWEYIKSIDKNTENDITNRGESTAESTWYYESGSILENKLRSNQTASSAKQEMMNIKRDIADIEAEIEDLPNQARAAFKWDVPDYIYKAFIANRQQELQKELNKLESRYTGLADIYKTEVANTQRELEYELKQREFDRQLTNDSRDRYYKEAQLQNDLIKRWTDANWNMVAFRFDPATWQMYQVSDGTAYATYQEAVQKSIARAKWQVWKYTWLECTGFTNKITQWVAWVTMKGKNWAATAEEKVEYATNPNVSDYIPVVWDVAVMVSNGKNGVSQKRWHTMYVDNVYTDKNWDTWFHYIATNKYGKNKEYTYGYEWQMRVTDFYKNGWAWFRNPFKQAQYDNRATITNKWYDTSLYLDPMEAVVDAKVKTWKLTVSQLDSIYKFWNSYNKLYTVKSLWYMDKLINSWEFASFLRDVDLNRRDIDKTRSMWGDAVAALVTQLESAASKKASWDAYNAYAAIIWVLETKLREESWARINKNEWSRDFMQYLPEASDSTERKKYKLTSLENWLRWFAKKWWITADEYVPIFDFTITPSDSWKGKTRNYTRRSYT